MYNRYNCCQTACPRYDFSDVIKSVLVTSSCYGINAISPELGLIAHGLAVRNADNDVDRLLAYGGFAMSTHDLGKKYSYLA